MLVRANGVAMRQTVLRAGGRQTILLGSLDRHPDASSSRTTGASIRFFVPLVALCRLDLLQGSFGVCMGALGEPHNRLVVHPRADGTHRAYVFAGLEEQRPLLADPAAIDVQTVSDDLACGADTDRFAGDEPVLCKSNATGCRELPAERWDG